MLLVHYLLVQTEVLLTYIILDVFVHLKENISMA